MMIALQSTRLPNKPINVSLQNLVECPHVATTIAQWFKAEWGEWTEHQSIEKTIQKFEGRLNTEVAPCTYVAFLDGKPVGTASLILQEMTIHRDHKHWLGDLYVVPELRGRGIGSSLIEGIISAAKKVGAESVSLYTENQETLYAKKGWKTFDRPTYDGHVVAVMERKV